MSVIENLRFVSDHASVFLKFMNSLFTASRPTFGQVHLGICVHPCTLFDGTMTETANLTECVTFHSGI